MRKANAVKDSDLKLRPALTPEAEEDELVALAFNLVRERLANGTTKAKLEKQLLEKEVELKAAKTESIKSSQRSDELYQEAIKAFRGYSGQEDMEDE